MPVESEVFSMLLQEILFTIERMWHLTNINIHAPTDTVMTNFHNV